MTPAETTRIRRFTAVASTEAGRLAGRYLVLSACNLLVGQAVLALLFGVAHLNARDANLLAVAIGTGPAYYAARRWVWRRRGRSHLLTEVAPFWALSVTAALLSTLVAAHAEELARSMTPERSLQTVVVVAATGAAYGAIFVVRFLAFNRLFRTPAPADGPTVGCRP